PNGPQALTIWIWGRLISLSSFVGHSCYSFHLPKPKRLSWLARLVKLSSSRPVKCNTPSTHALGSATRTDWALLANTQETSKVSRLNIEDVASDVPAAEHVNKIGSAQEFDWLPLG